MTRFMKGPYRNARVDQYSVKHYKQLTGKGCGLTIVDNMMSDDPLEGFNLQPIEISGYDPSCDCKISKKTIPAGNQKLLEEICNQIQSLNGKESPIEDNPYNSAIEGNPYIGSLGTNNQYLKCNFGPECWGGTALILLTGLWLFLSKKVQYGKVNLGNRDIKKEYADRMK